MKKLSGKPIRTRNGNLLPEYDVDYTKSKPNRFAKSAVRMVSVVSLEPDVAEAFPSAKQVNSALRSLIKTGKSSDSARRTVNRASNR